jgi:ssDNA thymidine ADP-ribosyltransferase DarT-like protein
MTVPANPLIYHITHIDNLPSIIADGGLVSDAVMVARGGPQATIGMSGIKQRRLTLPVDCQPGTNVGEYVPFYFCPRSVMLYIIARGNHPDLSYRSGQGPVLHLEADLNATVAWAAANGKRWAFSLSNAGAYYAEFRCSLAQLVDINWAAVASTDFRDPSIKEGKQAEFLLQEKFPWSLVTRAGAASVAVRDRAVAIISHLGHRPPVDVRPDWYY